MWVFGYASLIWNPGFPVAEQALARARGYSRSFCMRSIHHRGTPENPGLVLALDRVDHGYCDGVVFRVKPGEEADTLAYLRERELISSAYLERTLAVTLKSGGAVEAITYVIDPDHVQYCGGLPLDEQASIIAGAVGGRGPNPEYLFNTADHLKELGIEDPDLTGLADQVRRLQNGQ